MQTQCWSMLCTCACADCEHNPMHGQFLILSVNDSKTEKLTFPNYQERIGERIQARAAERLQAAPPAAASKKRKGTEKKKAQPASDSGKGFG